MTQIALFACILPTILRALGYAWEQVEGGDRSRPVWALQRLPVATSREVASAAMETTMLTCNGVELETHTNPQGFLIVNQYAYRIARHPHQDANGEWQTDRERCGWTVDFCWAVAPIWEPYVDGPFATPQEAVAAFAAKGCKPMPGRGQS